MDTEGNEWKTADKLLFCINIDFLLEWHTEKINSHNM